tara:strand:- start:591 stop:833 length:243 start_codon:yes stop_codon:yes gene_type:complete
MEGKKFTLGAALLFEEATGKSVTELAKPGISDVVAMIWAQENWDNEARPSLAEYTKSLAGKDLSEVTQALNSPFSQAAAQ